MAALLARGDRADRSGDEAARGRDEDASRRPELGHARDHVVCLPEEEASQGPRGEPEQAGGGSAREPDEPHEDEEGHVLESVEGVAVGALLAGEVTVHGRHRRERRAGPGARHQRNWPKTSETKTVPAGSVTLEPPGWR